jgi:hypothetical protein
MEPNDEVLNSEVTETEEIKTEDLEKVVGGGGSYGAPTFENN